LGGQRCAFAHPKHHIRGGQILKKGGQSEKKIGATAPNCFLPTLFKNRVKNRIEKIVALPDLYKIFSTHPLLSDFSDQHAFLLIGSAAAKTISSMRYGITRLFIYIFFYIKFVSEKFPQIFQEMLKT